MFYGMIMPGMSGMMFNGQKRDPQLIYCSILSIHLSRVPLSSSEKVFKNYIQTNKRKQFCAKWRGFGCLFIKVFKIY